MLDRVAAIASLPIAAPSPSPAHLANDREDESRSKKQYQSSYSRYTPTNPVATMSSDNWHTLAQHEANMTPEQRGVEVVR
ncbi:hypothetical protein LTR29_008394 [Friedmanniomyces endolithicus]|nr:hypothetical protein LTR29_008394 [Friedmanniomyces endolithicus]